MTFDGEHPVWKCLQLYGTLTGLYWLMAVLSNVVVLAFPFVLRREYFEFDRPSAAFFDALNPAYTRIIRVEALATIAMHAAIVWGLGIPVSTYVVMYAGFGVSWSAMQVPCTTSVPCVMCSRARGTSGFCGPLDRFWLHHNWHLTHHKHPTVPWVHLPRIGQREDPERGSCRRTTCGCGAGPAGRPTAWRIVMPAVSSAERAIDVPIGIRAAMVVTGWIPALHVLLTCVPLVLAVSRRDWWFAVVSAATLYLLPPIVVRMTLWWWPLSTGRVELTSPGFLLWWATAQCQVIYTRLPWLEEVLRLLPGLYSAWLRLWGARVGSLVYWSPGVVVLDRSLVRIGDRVVFGMGVRVIPHVIAPVSGGRAALFVAPIAIGADALLGGYSLLLTGCEIADREVTRPLQPVHAFSRVEGGRRTRLPNAPVLENPDAA